MPGNVIDYVSDINWDCHGIPERCFAYKGKRMKICARCLGCNIGHMIAVALFAFNSSPAWYYSILLSGVMLLDWSLQTYFDIMSNNIRRLVTGVVGGIGIGSLLWGIAYFVASTLANLMGQNVL